MIPKLGRVGQQWWTCDRCGVAYPEDRVVVQKGLIVCQGTNTNRCRDEYGAGYYRRQVEVGYEEPPTDLPVEPWEDD